MNKGLEKVGCESYLYKPIQCCLNPCVAEACPEPICAMEFPGGINAYLRYKRLQQALRSGLDLDQAAQELNISKQAIRVLFNKGNKILGWISLR